MIKHTIHLFSHLIYLLTNMENYYEVTKERNEAIINELILEAGETEDVIADTLKFYNISKSSVDNCKTIEKESTKAVLEKVADFLGCDPKAKKKPELAKSIIEKVATLLLEPCRLCNDYYSVKRTEKPLLSCYFCGQGCHNACYDEATLGRSPIIQGMFFICLSCENEEKKSLKLNSSSVKPSKRTQHVEQSTLNEHGQELSTIQSNQNKAEDGNDNGKPPHDAGRKKVPAVCKFYKKGTCKYGLSGNSGGKCKFSHPKLCHKYANYGRFGEHGCKNHNCSKWHPKICYTGVSTGVCSKPHCRYFHGSGITRAPRHSDAPPRRNSHGYDVNLPQEVIDNEMRDDSPPISFLETIRVEMESWKNQIFQSVQDLHHQMAMQKQQAYQQPYLNHNPLASQSQLVHQNQIQMNNQSHSQMNH